MTTARLRARSRAEQSARASATFDATPGRLVALTPPCSCSTTSLVARRAGRRLANASRLLERVRVADQPRLAERRVLRRLRRTGRVRR